MLTIPTLAHAGGYSSYCYPRTYTYAAPVKVQTSYVQPQVYQVTKYQAVPQTVITYNISYAQPAAVQGNSVYGIAQINPYSVSPDLAVQLAHNTAQRLTLASESVAIAGTSAHAQATAGHTAISESVAKVGAIQAYNAGVAAAAQSVSPTFQNCFNGGASATVTTQTQAGAQTQAVDPVLAGVQAKCAACHSPEAAAAKGGGFDIGKMDNSKIYDHVVILRDMPKGGQLTAEELRAVSQATRNQ
jgi:mono/diheme cytochrome c family protein